MGKTQHRTSAIAAAAVLAGVTAVGAAGCSDGADDAGETATEPSSSAASPSTSTTPTPSASPEPDPGTVLPVTVRGDSVEPRAKRVRVAVGEPLTLAIDSDSAGELHVHATPETELAFGPGTSRKQIVLDQPGVVEVELHEPTEVTVFQLEVR